MGSNSALLGSCVTLDKLLNISGPLVTLVMSVLLSWTVELESKGSGTCSVLTEGEPSCSVSREKPAPGAKWSALGSYTLEET